MSDRGRSTHLLLNDFERLEEWCRLVLVVFDEAPFLVGSVMTTPEYRDVDLRLILDDETFDATYAGKRAKVRLLNRAISTWGQRETGLPIDFQIQRRSEANRLHPKARRSPMGVRDWSKIPTDGVP